MSLDIAWEQHEGYGAARLSGSPTLGQMLSCIELIAAETAQWKPAVLLVDLRQVDSLRSFTEQFAIGEHAAARLAHLDKIASVVPPERITRNSERPARRKGLNLLVFTAEEEAIAWLTSGE